MEVAKEKMKDMVSKAKEKVVVQNAKSEERAEKRAAGSRGEKEIAHELSRARQAEAKMDYHIERAEHRAETLAHRAAGTNGVSPNAVLSVGGGAFYNAPGPAFGGTPERPGGGAVGPQGVVDADPAYGGVRPPAGAVYPQQPGNGNAASAYGAGVAQNNNYV